MRGSYSNDMINVQNVMVPILSLTKRDVAEEGAEDMAGKEKYERICNHNR